MTLSVLTFLSSSARFGIATTLVPESGLIEGKVNEEFFFRQQLLMNMDSWKGRHILFNFCNYSNLSADQKELF